MYCTETALVALFAIVLQFPIAVFGQQQVVVWKPTVLINAGSSSAYKDMKGNIWQKDGHYNTGVAYEATQNFTIQNANNTDVLYLSNRRDNSTDLPNLRYTISLKNSNGKYKVVLHWAELRNLQAGERVFNVRFGTEKMLSNYDVVAKAGGRFRAVTEELYTNVTNGRLQITFEAKIGVPFISAIGVHSQTTRNITTIGQPKVTVVEIEPLRYAQGSVSIPEGSPWCGGGPTFWWIGHDNKPETPACLDLKTGNWSYPQIATLDRTDPLNAIDGPENIDRHDCTLIDMNADNVMDLICVVGANKGKGNGFTEVYMTQPNGSVKKVLDGHGLHKYPTMRTRLATTLSAADGASLVVIANEGTFRVDGQPNQHRMFRLVSPATATNTTPIFEEVQPDDGPWIQTFVITCLVAGDLNNDGIDDFVMGDEDGPAQLMVQNKDMTWKGISLSSIGFKGKAWNNVRIADVSGDGVADLIACGPHFPWRVDRDDSFVRVFKGDPSNPMIFDFDNPYYEFRPTFEPMDVEVSDLNGDGIPDIYVVLQDRSKLQTFCRDGTKVKGAPFPPIDFAHDYVLVGQPQGAPTPFEPVELFHEIPGCGGHVAKWRGQQSLMLHQSTLSRRGYGVVLDW